MADAGGKPEIDDTGDPVSRQAGEDPPRCPIDKALERKYRALERKHLASPRTIPEPTATDTEDAGRNGAFRARRRGDPEVALTGEEALADE